MTPQLTAMIPISRRTIARASGCWASAGRASKSTSPQLALGGAGAGALGEEGDERAAGSRRGSGGRRPARGR